MPRSKSQDNLYRTMQAYVRMDPSYTPDIGHLVFPNREEREREYQRAQAGSSGSGVTRSQPATPSKPRYKISDIFSRRSSKDKQQQSNNHHSMDEQWRVGGGRFRQGARAESIQSGMMSTRTGRGRIGASASMDRGVSRYRAGDGGGAHAPWYQAWHGAASTDQVAYTHAIQRQQSTFGGGNGRQNQRISQPSSRRVSPNRIYDLTTTSTQSTSGSNAITNNAAARKDAVELRVVWYARGQELQGREARRKKSRISPEEVVLRESNISVVQIRNSQDPHEISNHYSAINTNTRSYHGSRSNTPSGGRNTSAISMASGHQQGLTKHQSLGSTSYGYAMQMFARESQSSGYDSADKPVLAGPGKQPWSPLPQDGDRSFVEFDTSLLSSLNVVHPNWMHSHQYSLDESNRRVKCAHIDAIGASRTGSRLADHGYVNETNTNRRVQRQMTELSQPSSSYTESHEIPVKNETPKQSPKKYDPPSIPKRFEEPTIPQHSHKVTTTTTITPPSAISPRLMQLGLPALFSPPPVTPILSPPLDFQDKDTPQPTKSPRQTFFRRSPLLSRSDAIRDSDGSPPVTPPPTEVKPTPVSPANDESQKHKSPSPMKEQQKQLQQQLQEQKLQQQLQHQLLQHQFQEQEKTYRMTQTRSLEDTSAARRTQFIQKHGESSSSSSQSTQQLITQVATFRSLDSCLTRGGMPRLSEMTTDSSIEIREDDADDEGNNSSSINIIVRPQSRERISPSSRNSRVQYRAQTRRSPGSSDNRASNCNSRDVSSSSDEDVLACSRSPSGTLSNTRRVIPVAPLRQGPQEETYVRKQGPSEESGYVRRSCSLQLPEIPTNFLGRLSPQNLYKEVPSNPGSKRTSRCTTPQQQSIDYDMKREVEVVTEFVGASRCSAAAKSLLEDRIPNLSNTIIVTRENGPYINTAGRKAPQVPPRNCSLNKQQSQQIDNSEANMPIYDTLDFNYLAQQQYQQQRFNQQQFKQQQQYWKQEYNRSQNLLGRSRLHQRRSPSPTKTLEAPVPSFQQRRLSPNTKSSSADQHVTLPQRRSPIPITRSLNPSNSSSNSDVFLAASATNSPRPPGSAVSSGSSTPVLDYSDISVPKNYETVSFGDFARELIATRPGSAQSAITHQQHQVYQQQRGRASASSLVQLHQQRSTSLPRTLSTIGDEGSVSDKTLTPTWQSGGTESQRFSPGGHRRRRRLQPNSGEAAQTVHTAPVSPLHETYRRRAVSPSAQVDVSAKSSPKAHSTPSQLDISARDQSREQSRNQSRAQSREQSPDNTLGKKRPSPTEDKSTSQRLASDNKARQIAPAAKGGLLSSIKREFGRLGGRGSKSSASIDLGMNMQQREIESTEAATIGDQAGPSKLRMGPKQQMSLDSIGRDVSPRGRITAPPRTLSLNTAPVSTLLLQHHQQQSVDKPEGKQRFAAFGIGFMRSSKEKKKLNKSDRNKKCHSTDSGIQLEISGGDCTDDGCSHPTAPLHHNNTTLWSHISLEHPNVTTINGETSIIHITRRASTSSYVRSTNVSIDEPSHLLYLQPQESIAPQSQCNGLYDHSEQHPQQHQSQQQRVSNESDKQLCSREGSSEDGNKTSGSINGNELPRGSEDPDSVQTKRGRIVNVESVTGSRSRSRSRSRAKSGTLRPEKIRRIKTSILCSPHLPIITHHHPKHLSIRRTNSDLTQQHLRNLIYKKRYTSTAYMSSPTCAPIMGGPSHQIPCSTNSTVSNDYITRIDVNLDSNSIALNTEVNRYSAAEDIVQLRRSSCAMWRNRSNRVGLGHPLRRSLSQPLDVDRLKEALVVVRGKRALRLHRSPTSSNQQHSSGGTTTPTTTPTGTTSASAASTSAATTSDEEDNNSDTDDSVSYAERANQSLRQRRVSLEELPNTSGETLRENGVEEEQVVVLAEAVFDHVAIESEELAFKAGDVIEVQQTGDRNWWWGSTGGNTGWFPAERVRLRVSQEDTFEDCIAALQSGNTVPTPLRRRTSISLLSNDQVRTSVVRELVHTERDFVKVLLDVSEGYIAECRKRTEMFTSCQIDTIFLNIKEILRFQTAFLKDLEKCIDWDAPHKSCVGECFLKHRDGFTIYSHYCNGHTLASATLQELCQLNNYIKFFEACRLMRGLIEIPLHGYLLAPVQRICKYPLQLAELLKYTRSGHRDHHHIQQALTAMRDVATLINDRKRRMESLEKLQLWQLRVEGWQGYDLIDLSTQMIHQGEAKRISVRRVTSNIMLFLFDYQVIYCKKDILNRNSYSYKGRISMDTTEIIDLSDGKDLHVHMNVRNAIKLYSCVSDWFLLFCCRTRGDKQRWLDAFKEERRLVEADRAARLHLDFLPAARHLARVAVRCQAAGNNLPRKPTEKDLTNGSFRMNGQISQHSNSNSLGRRMGTWFTFGGNTKRKRHRPRDTN